MTKKVKDVIKRIEEYRKWRGIRESLKESANTYREIDRIDMDKILRGKLGY